MAFDFKEFLLGTLTTTLETLGESKLIEVLQTLHEKNPVQWEAAVRGGHALVVALLPITQKTQNKIDDAIIQALDDALKISAANNNLTL